MDVDSVGAGIAAVNGAIAVGLALTSFIGVKRLQATHEWLERAIHLEEGDHAKVALRDEARRITARLVARQQVPPTLFVELVIWTLFVAVLAATSNWVAIIAGFATLWLTARRAMRLVKERIRVVSDVYAGQQQVSRARVGILHQFEGGTRDEFAWAALYAVGVSTLSISVANVIKARGLQEAEPWTLYVGLAGASILVMIVDYWRRKFHAALIQHGG